MSESKNLNRRTFFQFVLAGTILVPSLLKAKSSCPAKAPAGKMIADPAVGIGKTLQYVVDGKMSKSPKYKTGNSCANCKFFNSAKLDSGYAPCTMMGMKYVTECGWCTSFALKG